MAEYILDWEVAKLWLVGALGFGKPLLHVYFGLGIFVAAAMLLRRPFGSLLPISVVVLAQTVNEALDWARYRLDGYPWGFANWAGDTGHSLFWPVLLFLLARYTRLGHQPQRATRTRG